MIYPEEGFRKWLERVVVTQQEKGGKEEEKGTDGKKGRPALQGNPQWAVLEGCGFYLVEGRAEGREKCCTVFAEPPLGIEATQIRWK